MKLDVLLRVRSSPLIRIPAQVIRTGRKIVLRVMAYNSWMPVLFRGIDALRALRC